MDSGKRWLLLLILAQLMCVVMGNLVFEVHHKYGGRGKGKAALEALRAHDSRRHGRMLAAIDFQLGGDISPTNAALYYTKITIGTPPIEYHVQVDTGSDALWVNCHNCENCLTESRLHIQLKQYDLMASSTGKNITCDQDFCDAAFSSTNANCQAGMNCKYAVSYADGSIYEGYIVRDNFRFDQVTGNLQTSAMNGSIAFGCSTKQSGVSGSSTEHVDGIVGFGQANSSILSQLASSGRVKKIFSHCLDGNKGGGTFAIGEVVQPIVSRIPLVPNEPHYNVNLKSVEVGGQLLNMSGSGRGTTIDSGTTLAHLPSEVYQQLLSRMMAQHPALQTYTLKQFTCFRYSGNVDDGFPVVKFHFEDSLVLPVNPSNYLLKINVINSVNLVGLSIAYHQGLLVCEMETDYCIGWQKSVPIKNGKEMTLLGDIVLTDKLIVYDLENQTIGWTEYNCSSSISVRDDSTGNVYAVASHDISSAFSVSKANFIAILLFVAALRKLME